MMRVYLPCCGTGAAQVVSRIVAFSLFDNGLREMPISKMPFLAPSRTYERRFHQQPQKSLKNQYVIMYMWMDPTVGKDAGFFNN
jgi:hypothetical protein